MTRYRQRRWHLAQAFGHLVPIPFGIYCVYKAIQGINRAPPPIYVDGRKALQQPLRSEPVYLGMDLSRDTIGRNMTPRGWTAEQGHASSVTATTHEQARYARQWVSYAEASARISAAHSARAQR